MGTYKGVSKPLRWSLSTEILFRTSLQNTVANIASATLCSITTSGLESRARFTQSVCKHPKTVSGLSTLLALSLFNFDLQDRSTRRFSVLFITICSHAAQTPFYVW